MNFFKSIKKLLWIVCGSLVAVWVVIGISVIVMIAAVLGASEATISNNSCTVDTEISTTSQQSSSDTKIYSSITEFVKAHQEAYIEAWGAGGFLPSASITQTQMETSFNHNVPSFGQAHNMGGVKWSSLENYPITLSLYGDNAVSNNGAGTDVGDGTGGSYAYFISFDAGIVGKAEFMSRQTLYTGAINNTDGSAALAAIADGGWATDPEYKVKLQSMYSQLGVQFKWLDELAIEKYGPTPVKTLNNSIVSQISPSNTESDGGETDYENGFTCDNTNSDNTGTAIDGSGSVPGGLTESSFRPDDLPASLKEYILDPKKYGMVYGSKTGWFQTGSDYLDGQCVNLTISLGNLIWGHSGSVLGDGIDQAHAWANIFGNSTTKTPKKGAIFSSGVNNPGHTGIVCHVFKDGSILVVEQNTALSGIDFYGQSNTWNYSIRTPEQQVAKSMVFAYPTNRTPVLK